MQKRTRIDAGRHELFILQSLLAITATRQPEISTEVRSGKKFAYLFFIFIYKVLFLLWNFLEDEFLVGWQETPSK